MTAATEPRPVLVIHGVATRDRAAFEAEVAELDGALGPEVELIPVFWGDHAPPADSVDRVLPYLKWSEESIDEAPEDEGTETEDEPGLLKTIFSRGDLDESLSAINKTWQRVASNSRKRLLGEFYALFREQYLRASAQFTGDLVLYQRQQADFHALIWETIMRRAPGYGLHDKPVDVIAHSLGATMMFDLAVMGRPALHIDHLITCASQTGFFHVIGAHSVQPDRDDPHAPVELPDTIGSWLNLFVPLDPWAFLAEPVFRLHDGSPPADVEVHAGDRSDRVMTHAAAHYWSHPIALDAIRDTLGLTVEVESADAD